MESTKPHNLDDVDYQEKSPYDSDLVVNGENQYDRTVDKVSMSSEFI